MAIILFIALVLLVILFYGDLDKAYLIACKLLCPNKIYNTLTVEEITAKYDDLLN